MSNPNDPGDPGNPSDRVDIDAVIRALEHDEVARAKLRAVLLGEELLALPQAVAKLSAQVAELARQVSGLTRQVTKLNAMMERYEARFDRIETRLDHIEADVSVLKTDVSVLKTDVGDLKGTDLERRVREHPKRYLGALLRSARLFDIDEAANVEGLHADELVEVLRADAVFEAVDRSGEELFVVVEISWNAHKDDISRALDRARLLSRATGSPVLPLVVSASMPAEVVVASAAESGVGLFCTDRPQPLVPGLRIAA